MKHTVTLAAVALLLGAGPASAGDDKARDKDGRQCSLEYTVGSHLPKRVCSTAAEREALRKASQDKMMNLRQQSQIGGRSGAQ